MKNPGVMMGISIKRKHRLIEKATNLIKNNPVSWFTSSSVTITVTCLRIVDVFSSRARVNCWTWPPSDLSANLFFVIIIASVASLRSYRFWRRERWTIDPIIVYFFAPRLDAFIPEQVDWKDVLIYFCGSWYSHLSDICDDYKRFNVNTQIPKTRYE